MELIVSVVVISYNQEQYISQALESILMQQTDFDFEIIVGDDASTDATPGILEGYRSKYPDRMRVVLRRENIGPTKNDYLIKMLARGKYIAQLEGDDVWTDKNKLQAQVDFLENNEDYVACSHKCDIINSGGIKLKRYSHVTWANVSVSDYTVENFVRWETPGHTSALVYRNIFKRFDCSALYKLHPFVGDRTMALLLLARGKIYCMDRPMSGYRYIEKEDARNWMSAQSQNPYKAYDDSMYINRLEQYAKRRLGIKIDVKSAKKRNIDEFCRKVKEAPAPKRFAMLLKMLVKSRHAVSYFFSGWFILPDADLIRSANVCQNRKLAKMTWNRVKEVIQGRELVIFGAGNCCANFLCKYAHKYKPLFVVDNNHNKWGTRFGHLEVHNPKRLLDMDKNKIFVLITHEKCAEEMSEQLEEMGITQYASFVHLESKKWYCSIYRFLCGRKPVL